MSISRPKEKFIDTQESTEQVSGYSMRYILPAALAFILIMAFTLVAFFTSYDNYKSSIQSQFDRIGSVDAQAIQRSLRDKELILESARQLFLENQANISSAGMRSFLRPFESEMEGVQALQWLVPVHHADREQFEQARRQDGITDFSIREVNAAGKVIPAATREIYYPVYPLPPIDVGEASIGYDIASDPIRRDAIAAAITSGELRASAWVRLLQQQTDDSFGFLVFVPLFADDDQGAGAANETRSIESPTGLLGLVTGIFQINAIVRDSISILAEGPVTLFLQEDPQDESGHSVSLSATAAEENVQGGSVIQLFQPAPYVTNIEVGEKFWMMTVSPAANYMDGKQAQTSWIILLVGSVLAVLIPVYLTRSSLQAMRIHQAQQEKYALEIQSAGCCCKYAFPDQTVDAFNHHN